MSYRTAWCWLNDPVCIEWVVFDYGGIVLSAISALACRSGRPQTAPKVVPAAPD